MEEEIWKDIPGYEGLYKVSNLGRVRSFADANPVNRRNRILKQHLDGKGNYLFVGLHRDGKVKLATVHRLVANAFVPNPLNLPQVNHKDECKTNNRADNLEWCTRSYNSRYGGARERMLKSRRENNDMAAITEKIKRTKILRGTRDAEKAILQFSMSGEFIQRWASATDAERKLGISRVGIRKCCIGEYKQARGYIWVYEKSNNRQNHE